ncbi:hypoxanthine phosphoribosyltransferase [Tepidibacter formicigenes]|jgi:hypoxanthine phosphoribosyltransferase|uniref:Hypoxanthine phosphoribosyltransferase n=1 Tax=Tepidibacter formicigenes DSM 15518 TaxID=1123349 RepID=A0A1M6MLT6_9FIRM|nr:hypoxanthine phosphoribosyltransferase [Tepidibacter formicigenes]SHJ84384.1 hypoxanthine phosphoribosyltransferase [Tepidibacter formicigenes DSM 15518]
MDIEKKVWETLCSEEDIKKRVTELGQQISNDYKDKKLFVISLLKGSFIFTADLVRKIDIPVKIGFMTTSSYGHGEESSGKVNLLSDIADDISGYDVLVVDDITDSALTMSHVMEHLKTKNPSSIKCCVLLDKPNRRKVDLVPDYVGFTIEDKFVVGYGLNYGDYYRNIPYVFNVTNEDR